MKKLTEKIRIEIKKNSGFKISDSEKTNLVFSESMIIKNISDYNKVVLEIEFEKEELIPDAMTAYCFEENSNEEKKLFYNFNFVIHKNISPYQTKTPNRMIVDIAKLCKMNFTSIERIGFYIENIKDDLVFYCQIFEQE